MHKFVVVFLLTAFAVNVFAQDKKETGEHTPETVERKFLRGELYTFTNPPSKAHAELMLDIDYLENAIINKSIGIQKINYDYIRENFHNMDIHLLKNMKRVYQEIYNKGHLSGKLLRQLIIDKFCDNAEVRSLSEIEELVPMELFE